MLPGRARMCRPLPLPPPLAPPPPAPPAAQSQVGRERADSSGSSSSRAGGPAAGAAAASPRVADRQQEHSCSMQQEGQAPQQLQHQVLTATQLPTVSCCSCGLGGTRIGEWSSGVRCLLCWAAVSQQLTELVRKSSRSSCSSSSCRGAWETQDTGGLDVLLTRTPPCCAALRVHAAPWSPSGYRGHCSHHRPQHRGQAGCL